MNDINNIVNDLVAEIEEITEESPVTYEVWAIGYDEEDKLTGAEMLLGTFSDPDIAVSHAKMFTLADIVHLAADDECTYGNRVHYISVEVETVVLDTDDETAMNIGTIYRKKIEIFEELPQYIVLTAEDCELLENGDIMVPCAVLKDYNKNDCFTAILDFDNEEISEPMTYKIISKTTANKYQCEFV